MQVGKDFKIINGNNLEVLDTLEENSVDACVTDPPYELGFMGKKWDSTGIAYNIELWKKLYRVLKPGAYVLAFGGSRTFHRIACAIEDAGFEIRDTIMWLYGSGFPKSFDLGKAVESKVLNGNDYNEIEDKRIGKINYQTEEGKKWDGYGTNLKPAFEPIIMARKPVEDTVINNVLKHNVGGINIDECRIGRAGGGSKWTLSLTHLLNLRDLGVMEHLWKVISADSQQM